MATAELLDAPPATGPRRTGSRAVDPATRRVRAAMRRQVWAMLGIVAVVGYVDQVSKAWAWRHVAGTHVNSGGDLLVSPAVSDLFRNRVAGAVFDVVDAVLIGAALLLLARRRRPPGVLPAASVLLAGWLSNLADRLGMHYWTAPGSVRGAVDFLPFAGYDWNLADVAIVAGTAGLVVAVLAAGARRLAAPRSTPWVGVVRHPLRHPSVRAALVMTMVGVVVLAAVGAFVGGYGDSPGAVLAARGR